MRGRVNITGMTGQEYLIEGSAGRTGPLRATPDQRGAQMTETVHTFETICSFDACKNGVRSGHLCSSHYRQQHQGKPLEEIRPYKESYLNEHLRQCTKCGMIKWQEDFYLRTQGGRQSVCKVCWIERVVLRKERRAAEGK